MRDLGPGAFTEELDRSVLQGDADLAVHSLKDAPPVAPAGLLLAACLPREDPRDVLLTRHAHVTCLADLPPGTKLGTASSRRKAQVLAANPRVEVVAMRGNVDSRIQQMADGAADATLLALAGLRRLGKEVAGVHYVEVDLQEMLPAACQGIVGIVARASNTAVLRLLQQVSDCNALLCAAAERAVLEQLMVPQQQQQQQQPAGAENTRAQSSYLGLALRMPDHAVAVLATVESAAMQGVPAAATTPHIDRSTARPKPVQCELRVQALIADPQGTWLHKVAGAAALPTQDAVGRDDVTSSVLSVSDAAGQQAALLVAQALGAGVGQQLNQLGAQHAASQ